MFESLSLTLVRPIWTNQCGHLEVGFEFPGKGERPGFREESVRMFRGGRCLYLQQSSDSGFGRVGSFVFIVEYNLGNFGIATPFSSVVQPFKNN